MASSSSIILEISIFTPYPGTYADKLKRTGEIGAGVGVKSTKHPTPKARDEQDNHNTSLFDFKTVRVGKWIMRNITILLSSIDFYYIDGTILLHSNKEINMQFINNTLQIFFGQDERARVSAEIIANYLKEITGSNPSQSEIGRYALIQAANNIEKETKASK